MTDLTRDYLDLDGLFTADELAVRDRVRAFVDERVRPHIAEWYATATFPRELVKEMAALGLLGMHLHGYGCAGRSAVEYGLAAMELEAGDSGIRTFVSVQGSLAMSAIAKFGTEEQKQRWLPGMATGELIGCFGLTEPGAGSDPASMATRAVRDGDGWVLSGSKRWIGLASIADVAIVWAQTEDGIRGFVVPTASDGFAATPIEQKLSMRASIQCDVTLDGVRLPADALLPDARGLKGPFSCLNEARYGIMWGAMGAARDSYETALRYALERRQFGVPIAAFQLTQQKLVEMVLEIQKGVLVALRTGRLKDAGTLRPEQISFGKLNNVREAIAICRSARTILGGNGVTLEHSPLRHADNLESVRTYEGTDEVHTLIMGRAITGIPAFGGRVMEKILVVGAGAMGSQIGMVCALSGYATTVTDVADDALDRARSQLSARLDRDVAKGRRSRSDVDDAFARLTFTTDLDAAAADADLVIEAAVEKLEVKREVFARLDKVVPAHTILTTNSSAMMSSQLADATGRPDRVANMHFFNPALVMRCVEVVGSDVTSEETVAAVVEVARRLGKEPVVLRKEIPGFVANRILGAVRDEAIFLLENGIASVEDIDTACRTALGYPMGPFELMDLTGIDVGYHAKLARHAVTDDPRDLPSRTVTELVERGELGRKTGKGFYTYDEQGNRT